MTDKFYTRQDAIAVLADPASGAEPGELEALQASADDNWAAMLDGDTTVGCVAGQLFVHDGNMTRWRCVKLTRLIQPVELWAFKWYARDAFHVDADGSVWLTGQRIAPGVACDSCAIPPWRNVTVFIDTSGAASREAVVPRLGCQLYHAGPDNPAFRQDAAAYYFGARDDNEAVRVLQDHYSGENTLKRLAKRTWERVNVPTCRGEAHLVVQLSAVGAELRLHNVGVFSSRGDRLTAMSNVVNATVLSMEGPTTTDFSKAYGLACARLEAFIRETPGFDWAKVWVDSSREAHEARWSIMEKYRAESRVGQAIDALLEAILDRPDNTADHNGMPIDPQLDRLDRAKRYARDLRETLANLKRIDEREETPGRKT